MKKKVTVAIITLSIEILSIIIGYQCAINVAIPIIVGFIIDVILLTTLYFIDDTVKSEKDIEKKTMLKSLGSIPLNEKNNSLMIENNPKANMMKYIKDIRNNIVEKTNKQTILITSCNGQEGKSWISNNLAVAFARINKKVLLIDADLSKISNKHEIFYIEKGEGLSEFIRDITEDNLQNLYKTREYIKETQIPNLHILQNGTIPFNPLELISSKKMEKVLNILKRMYDIIIIDGVSYISNAENMGISSIVDTNILVVESRKTKNSELMLVKDSIIEQGGDVLGFILNKTNIKYGKFYGKNGKNSYGMYIETIKKEELKKSKSLNEIIDKVEDEMKEKLSDKFEVMYDEMKENILIEDFINDIEVNFNTRLENIEKSNKEHYKLIVDKFSIIEENNQNINKEISKYNYNKSSEIKFYKSAIKKMMEEFKNLDEGMKYLKTKQTLMEKREQYYKKCLEQIINRVYEIDYDEYLNAISEQIENNHNIQGKFLKGVSDQIEDGKKEQREQFKDVSIQIDSNNKQQDDHLNSVSKQIESNDNEQVGYLMEVLKQIENKHNLQGKYLKAVSQQIEDNYNDQEDHLTEVSRQIESNHNAQGEFLNGMSKQIENRHSEQWGHIDDVMQQMDDYNKQQAEYLKSSVKQIIENNDVQHNKYLKESMKQSNYNNKLYEKYQKESIQQMKGTTEKQYNRYQSEASNQMKDDIEKQYDRYLKETIKQISDNIEKQYNKYLKETKKQLNYRNKKYDEYLKRMMEQIQNNNIKHIEEIKRQMDKMEYNKQLENIDDTTYNMEIKDIRDLAMPNEEKKDSKIINLRRFLKENGKTDDEIYSIEQSISYEDLEKFAYDIVELEDAPRKRYKRN